VLAQSGNSVDRVIAPAIGCQHFLPNSARPSGIWNRGIEVKIRRCDDFGMVLGPSSDLQEEAILDGGPMDGSRKAIDADTDQLFIVMSDGQQHRYVRTEEFQALEDGHLALVFRWNGRYYGPK